MDTGRVRNCGSCTRRSRWPVWIDHLSARLTSFAGAAARTVWCAWCQPCPNTIVTRPFAVSRGFTQGNPMQLQSFCNGSTCHSGSADLSCGQMCSSFTTKILDRSYEILTRYCTASAAPAWRRVISPHQSDSSYRPQFHRILSPQSWLWLPVATRTSNCRAASSLCCRRDQQIPKSNGRY